MELAVAFQEVFDCLLATWNRSRFSYLLLNFQSYFLHFGLLVQIVEYIAAAPALAQFGSSTYNLTCYFLLSICGLKVHYLMASKARASSYSFNLASFL
jgi:hypothetical protein